MARSATRFVRPSAKKPGSAPGTLIPVGERRIDKSRISLIDYDAQQLQEREVSEIREVLPMKDAPTVTWINIDGLHDMDLIRQVGDLFGIHALTLEDIVNTGHRPKMEEFETYLLVVLKMLYFNEAKNHIETEQVGLVLGERFLISFQEIPGDVFVPVRERLRKGKGRIRNSDCGYLAYALIDAVVDHYFLVLEVLGEKIEDLEQELLADPTRDGLRSLYVLKRELIYFRKQVWPMRELLASLAREESAFVHPSVTVFLNDVYDHTIQVIDTLESFRDVLSGLLDVYLSTVSNRMNEVMKVLTIIATIFIPLSFIAGVYGMNFEYMPELKWRWGYPALLLILFGIFSGMLLWFRRKKWL
ncbi:MAG: magnesium transporter [Deltaproteobacteria bacterium SG8_13]|nr:MAG: magnesium transporter [Deltaproteobacteria bacterium SG8_13]